MYHSVCGLHILSATFTYFFLKIFFFLGNKAQILAFSLPCVTFGHLGYQHVHFPVRNMDNKI